MQLKSFNRAGGQPERDLKDALGQANKIVSLVGASKCGKTTLCDKYFGTKPGVSKILVDGGVVDNVNDVWSEAYRQLTGGAQEDYFSVSHVEAIEKFAERGLPILVDDFHYVEPDVQAKFCQQIKNAAARGVRLIILNTPHRGDDPIRSNRDLSGRFYSIDMGFWDEGDLKQIGIKGFKKLGIPVDDSVITRLATEALHSPQLMQTLCLETCWTLNADIPYERQSITRDSFNVGKVKARAVKSCNQETQFYLLKNGPQERGRTRLSFKFRDGGEGDVYDVLTRAIALSPPLLSMSLDEIKERVRRICREGEEPNIRAALNQIRKIFKDKRQPIQWDDEKRLLAILDPDFYFYLRCQLPNVIAAKEATRQGVFWE